MNEVAEFQIKVNKNNNGMSITLLLISIRSCDKLLLLDEISDNIQVEIQGTATVDAIIEQVNFNPTTYQYCCFCYCHR